MTHVGCPDCRLRFTAATASHLLACPKCGRPPQRISRGEELVGFRLFALDDVPYELPEAVAVSIPVTDPDGGRS